MVEQYDSFEKYVWGELLPLAYEVGSNYDTLFFEDMDIFEAQVKGYFNRVSFNAFVQGQYTNIAVANALGITLPNAIGLGLTGKGKETYKRSIIQYPSKPIDINKEAENKFRKELTEQDKYSSYQKRLNSFI